MPKQTSRLSEFGTVGLHTPGWPVNRLERHRRTEQDFLQRVNDDGV
jgi:hypothetical protein